MERNSLESDFESNFAQLNAIDDSYLAFSESGVFLYQNWDDLMYINRRTEVTNEILFINLSDCTRKDSDSIFTIMTTSLSDYHTI